MTRNTSFSPEREPLRDDDTLRLDTARVHGPFKSFNPTQAHFGHVALPQESGGRSRSDLAAKETPRDSQDTTTAVSASNVDFKWTSRNNRKGRHAIVVTPADDTAAIAINATPPPTNSFKQVLRGIGRMATYYPIWDVSYLVAFTFTWGSVIWVLNSFLVLMPYLKANSVSEDGVYYGGGITAFIGATVFEIGSMFLMLEAVNENRAGCFGWAAEQVYRSQFNHERGVVTRIVPDNEHCTHHHTNTANLVGKPAPKVLTADPTPPGARSWVWWPSWMELRTHYFHDIGFIACACQTVGATIFYISGFTGLPGIYNNLTTTAKLDGAYWVPQVLGGMGFVVSGGLFMLETQKHWWQPAPSVLGWHIGLWNLIGGVGFLLCPIFGLIPRHWAQFQACVSTFWGSCAFLIGSTIQWYESLEKHPVEEAKRTSS